MAATHLCHVDCDPQTVDYGNGQKGTAHMMYAAEPSSAAGRYQWELNREILNAGRRAWRESGQGQSRECRVWDEWRKNEPHVYMRYGLMGRRFSRELEESGWLIPA